MNILERVGHAIFVIMTQLCHGAKATQPIGEQLSVAMFQRIHGAGTGRMWPVAHITPTPGSDRCTEKESGDLPVLGFYPGAEMEENPAKLLVAQRLGKRGTCFVQEMS